MADVLAVVLTPPQARVILQALEQYTNGQAATLDGQDARPAPADVHVAHRAAQRVNDALWGAH